MKFATLAVLGGLCLAGNALAADPAPQQDTANANASLKIGIDAKTGKRRVLSSAESAALDAQAAPRTMARSRMAAPSLHAPPATFAESAAGGVSKSGITAYIAPMESLSSMTIERNADGTFTIREDGVPMGQHQHRAREVASE